MRAVPSDPNVGLEGHVAGDGAAGDTNGQGVNGVWWFLTPAGEKIAVYRDQALAGRGAA